MSLIPAHKCSLARMSSGNPSSNQCRCLEADRDRRLGASVMANASGTAAAAVNTTAAAESSLVAILAINTALGRVGQKLGGYCNGCSGCHKQHGDEDGSLHDFPGSGDLEGREKVVKL
ncbi:uncharacterized protein K489DRAFT_379911 [Dissoconium aciculare CBS 342.82]|uniref:Uncharacterized protein n=1 Tax=Dissoconium aciculare CBS 342.82 TaxID=1314786 RepID=A0A6J3M7C7_9PEZI|nr:uncharacterized protein K489DRAFT_379911 [Dissoconium aciculare CBS 342.82]KAF1823910.1 hypothetical protein K489DRAFT_379911 [Dissoconium aciculare CBS 342.82]